jgi:hypothetical protein
MFNSWHREMPDNNQQVERAAYQMPRWLGDTPNSAFQKPANLASDYLAYWVSLS